MLDTLLALSVATTAAGAAGAAAVAEGRFSPLLMQREGATATLPCASHRHDGLPTTGTVTAAIRIARRRWRRATTTTTTHGNDTDSRAADGQTDGQAVHEKRMNQSKRGCIS